MKEELERQIELQLYQGCHKTLEQASAKELYDAISKAAMTHVFEKWETPSGKRASYLSAEFLVGRLVYANLLNMQILGQVEELLQAHNIDISILEEIEDSALGNGGLGRLAACFLDSAATQKIPLDGYGIRYQYGLFKQYFQDGFQCETADDWQRFGDPWSVRREDETVEIVFGDQTVKAVPYDTPVIGYDMAMINTMRLWQAEPLKEFDFALFNAQKYDGAVKEKNEAENISKVLYPNDDTDAGKRLRLKQQYFFSSASVQDMIKKYKAKQDDKFAGFSSAYAIQLNDTHPTVAIPEFLRILVGEEKIPFAKALKIARDTFAYTNHTVMPEALEKWNVKLFRRVLPAVWPYVVKLDKALQKELSDLGVQGEAQNIYRIIDGDTIHMARMAIFATHSTNGVAALHTEILKESALHEWYKLYPQRFNNKTNGITQRRWLGLANRELSALITEKIGDKWYTDLEQLKKLEAYTNDEAFLERYCAVKQEKKKQLCAYVEKHEGVKLHEDFLFDIQVKRLHEYKRQLLNAFGILDTYYGIKEGRITNFTPTVYLFGAKAAPGYMRAKGIIKFINEIAKLVNNDSDVNTKMQVLFVSNYNVSYAEKIIPAADVSQQISTAGTEASGTGNMKFMLNGAVTLGTWDGANVEIAQQAGEANEYIFGARKDEIEALQKGDYNPKAIMEKEPRLKRVVESLVDGTFSDGETGMFKELYTSLTEGASWHKPDHYFIARDFIEYCDARLAVNQDYQDKKAFAKKCLINTANAGTFSSDRTIKEYAKEIWGLL
ncbi:MAG: glycogen/starch/alpha-glucan phosphorylase [Oscillospiraceae bacterium]|nr:glycogen/starch/alpha-glucan phosphorylase [Oscillospiraceae bacterium]